MASAPTAAQVRSAKAAAIGGGRKRCVKGKSCSATCIDSRETCLVELPEPVQGSLGKVRDYLAKHGAGIAEHGAKGVLAWKTGKILAPAVTGYLESHYGIPREMSSRMTETVIQAAMATALEAKHLRSADTFLKKLLTETAAAYLGKAAHGGIEHALSSQELRPVIQQAAPILAGKVTGIATAFAGGKIPSPGEMAKIFADRAREDTQKLIGMVRPQTVGFAEEEDSTEIAKLLADVAVASIILSQG